MILVRMMIMVVVVVVAIIDHDYDLINIQGLNKKAHGKLVGEFIRVKW